MQMWKSRHRLFVLIFVLTLFAAISMLFFLYLQHLSAAAAQPKKFYTGAPASPSPVVESQLLYPLSIVYHQDENRYEVHTAEDSDHQSEGPPQAVPIYTKIGEDLIDGLIPASSEFRKAIISGGSHAGQVMMHYTAPSHIESGEDGWFVVPVQGTFFQQVELGEPIVTEALLGGVYDGKPYYMFLIKDMAVPID